MKARHLKPDARARKALESEWADMFFLLGDELSLASPPLLAGISRRAFHGRAKPLGLRYEEELERTFGDVPRRSGSCGGGTFKGKAMLGEVGITSASIAGKEAEDVGVGSRTVRWRRRHYGYSAAPER